MAKTFNLFMASILVLAMIGMISADPTFTVSPTTITFDRFDTSKAFIMSNTNISTNLSVNLLLLPVINGVSFLTSGYTNGDNFSSSTVTVSIGTIDWTLFELGESYKGSFIIQDSTNTSENVTVTIEIKNEEFCEFENDGDVRVKIDDIDNMGIGDDGTWYPVDELEVTIELDNKGNEDIFDLEIEWGLYDESKNEWIIEVQDVDEFDLDEDDDDTVTFTFDLDGDLDIDLDELDDQDYILYVRATGTVDDANDTITCGSASDKISVEVEKHYVIANDLKLTGTTLCGSVVQLSADIFNIGSKDEEGITVEIISTSLSISDVADMGDIDAFDSKKLNFEFQIPEGLEEKQYKITLKVYDEDDDIYENSDDDESTTYIYVDVSGNCIVVPNANVLASLEDGGRAGSEIQVKATITNTGSVQETFTIEAADYSSWAELISIEPATVIVAQGTTQDVILTFMVNSDVSEKETFNLILTDSVGASLIQPIAITIEQGFSLKGSLGDNTYLWGIALANIVLILIIILVAVKAVKR